MLHQVPQGAPTGAPSAGTLPASDAVLAPSIFRRGHFFAELDRKFADFADFTLSTLGNSPRSIAAYRDAYRGFRKFLETFDVPEEHATAIEAWIAWNRKRGVGTVSVNSYWRNLRPFFKYLAKHHDVRNPFDGMKAPVLPSRVPKALPPASCQRILIAAENIPWKSPLERALAVSVFATILFAGLRRRELLTLTFMDVDVNAGIIHVWKGKGKGGGKDRKIYMTSELKEILRRYISERKARKLEAPGFFAIQPGGGMSLSTLRRIHARVQRASGLQFTLHSLRHSFVTALLRSGVPIHVARELAGHSHITTTEGYLRVWDEDLRSQIRKLSYGG
jgi:integrase/recombinase XerD